jgi:hypothetical protein
MLASVVGYLEFDNARWYITYGGRVVGRVESHEIGNDKKALAGRTFMKFRGPKAWVKAMQQFAESHGTVCNIHFVLIPGLDHNEAAMAIPARKIFAQKWAH